MAPVAPTETLEAARLGLDGTPTVLDGKAVRVYVQLVLDNPNGLPYQAMIKQVNLDVNSADKWTSGQRTRWASCSTSASPGAICCLLVAESNERTRRFCSGDAHGGSTYERIDGAAIPR